MTQLLIDRATLEQMVVGLQRMSSACELEGDNHRNGDKWYRLCDDADKALTAGRAALANAERGEDAATEPVAYRWVWKSKPHDIEGWCYTHTPPNHPELQEIEKLFTHPMPALDVTELADAAYDEVQRQIVDRYRVEKSIGGFWPCCVKAGDGTMDIFVGSKKQAEHVRQALQTACLDGAFMTSKAALSKYKGAK